ncbi:MAG: hypothetical protein KDC12_07530 [Flavobacteriales bacterium]|nr:hypothetical protein [Flavobacteriales bacterium]
MKKWIDEHRSEFDEEFNADRVWLGIREELKPQGKVVSVRAVWQWSAVAAVAVLIALTVMFRLLSHQEPVLAEDKQPQIRPVELSEMGGELAEVEGYYVSQVNLYMSELQNFEVDEDMLSELEILKTEFETLKQELGRGVDKERIIEAMIDNYRFRLEILENMLEELKEKSHEKKNTLA